MIFITEREIVMKTVFIKNYFNNFVGNSKNRENIKSDKESSNGVKEGCKRGLKVS